MRPRPGIRHPRLPLYVAAATLALLLPVQAALQHSRNTHALLPREPAEAPGLAEVALTTGLGAGRAFVNISTWNAIIRAQREREYYRLIELCRAVLRLQPSNAMVQDYLVSQMVYTISRTEADAAEAWEWVRQGREQLLAARRRNPHSPLLRRAIAQLVYQITAEHPLRMLRQDLAAAADEAILAREPEWEALAHEVLAAYDALDDARRARLDHVIYRIGFSIVHTDAPHRFPEFAMLDHESQRIYEELNRFRHRMSLLELVSALDPATRVEGSLRTVLSQWAAARVESLLQHALSLPRRERPAEQMRVWRWAVRLMEWQPLPRGPEAEDYERGRRMTWQRLQTLYRDYGAPPGAVVHDGLDLVAHYFGPQVTEPPLPVRGQLAR